MAEFPFELVSPERLVFSGQVEQVVVPGSDGEFGVLAGHAPVMSTLKPGLLTIFAAGTEPRYLFVRGGFAEARPDGLTVLATVAMPLEELDAARLAQEIQDAEEDVADATDDAKRQAAQEKLEQLREFRAALAQSGLAAGPTPGH
ncbi:F0F1 ATP synthase subunit epsilon [Blastochloris viridis]|uniref:ATP synthase epsilon chain n=1 Tax=Blastochloris viridis TaxID=1079 RepID=A0A0H5B9J9_BLAVI|nr:F0F1 ATP synthase subunit epsilon [Blastochloris viridis]ALK07870.1 ATP synthase epsilon chain [Blastochloris viridis]BAR98882.1 ATP synthase epsilon chain [Blastochloris viridis]CUU43792.1 F-ATPase epsilon subunit [Blastochloris viridis]